MRTLILKRASTWAVMGLSFLTWGGAAAADDYVRRSDTSWAVIRGDYWRNQQGVPGYAVPQAYRYQPAPSSPTRRSPAPVAGTRQAPPSRDIYVDVAQFRRAPAAPPSYQTTPGPVYPPTPAFAYPPQPVWQPQPWFPPSYPLPLPPPMPCWPPPW